MNAITQMTLETDGNLTMAGGAYTDGPNGAPSSSRETKEKIQALSAEEAIRRSKT
jgi:hypothetical protein